jgi:hypothetical protein
MTEKANPSINRSIEAFKTAGAIAYGGSDEGFISPANETTEISIQDNDIDEAGLNAFEQTSSASSFEVTFEGGEAFVFGSWIAKDTPTTVILEPSTAEQTVFVGWNRKGTDDVILGLPSAFSSASGDSDQKIPLYSFNTDDSGVINVTDERSFDQIAADTIEQGAGSGLDADTVDGVEASALGFEGDTAKDLIGETVEGGDKVTATYDESAKIVTIDTAALDQAEVDTAVNDILDTLGLGELSGTTDDVQEGLTSLYFTDERAQDAVGEILGPSLRYDDTDDTITIRQGADSGLDADTLDGQEAADLGSDVSNDGSLVTSSSTDLNFEEGITAADDGDGTSTISVSDSFVKSAGDIMTGDLDMDGTNTVKNVAEPVEDTDVATRAFVESIAQGLNIKSSVRASTVNGLNVNLSSNSNPNPIDGVSLNDGDRVLLLEQNDRSENGIYNAVDADDPTTWVRSNDADEDSDVTNGTFTLVLEGDLGGNIGFIVTTEDPITLGQTDIEFGRFTGATNVSAGRGLTSVGSQLNVEDIFVESDGGSVDGNLSILDDVRLEFGSDNDFGIEYKSSKDALEIAKDGNVAIKLDSNGDILLSGGDVVLSGSDTLTNVSSPVNDTDVATKAFTEDKAAAPSYDNHRVALQNRFGAEGSTTTSGGFTTIAGSDLSFSPENYRDDSGQLAIRLHYHVKGDITIRMVRQNAGTPVSGTEASGIFGSAFGELDTGWVTFDDSGFESYQIQMRSNDGNDVSYNSVILDYGHPQ